VLVSLAPKSITAGVILGAIVVTPLMDRLGVRDYAARGFAVGLASHGIGTARAFSVNPVAGVFAGLAMGLNAVVTPAIVPAILPWFIG
jgi:putative effector of murein hydrolase